MRSASPNESSSVEKSVTIVAVGRQRVGKTTLLNALIQFYRPLGADVRIWNVDLQNATNHLGLFHADTDTVPPGSFEDTRLWLEARITDQVKEQYDAILDVGGGDTVLNKLAQEVRLVDMLERRGIRMVAVHVLGPDPADLDYLARFSNEDLFRPPATIIVLNEGLITSGQTPDNAFAHIRRHPALVQAVNRGARLRVLPVLTCMGQVTNRGLTFSDMANGKQSPDHEETSFFDQERTALWWERQMPAFFTELPSEWMPRIPRRSEEA